MTKPKSYNWHTGPFFLRAANYVAPWLQDRGSLTLRLQTAGSFHVRLLRQETGSPTADETAALNLKRHQVARLREVALYCNGHPVVFAHTVLPRVPRGALARWLDGLGSHSLGALLFADPRFKRGALEARRINFRHPLHRPARSALQCSRTDDLWARRSIFTFGAQKMLVTEVFSPSISRFRSTRPSNQR